MTDTNIEQVESKNKSISKTTILLLLLITLLIGSFGGYIYYKNKTDYESKGTKAAYTEGKVERFKQNYDYTNSLFPDLMIPLKGEEFDISQNDRTADKKLNYTITLSKAPANLLISLYTDNGSLDVGGSCFEKDDLKEISQTWYREKMKNQINQNIGFFYVQKQYYTFKEDKDFDKKYEIYKDFSIKSNRAPIAKETAVACSFAPRINKVKTIFEQEPSRKNNPVLTRFMIDNPKLSDEDMKRMDNIIAGSKL